MDIARQKTKLSNLQMPNPLDTPTLKRSKTPTYTLGPKNLLQAHYEKLTKSYALPLGCNCNSFLGFRMLGFYTVIPGRALTLRP